MLKKIEISGLRGFSKKQEMKLALPNKKRGSGLTTIVGINNTGKTTIIEAIKWHNSDINNISFSAGKRNVQRDSKVEIKYENEKSEVYVIRTKESGGSQVESDTNIPLDVKNIPFILPSRRNVQYELNGGFYENYRWDYMNSENMNTKVRKPTIDNFQQRIFNWEKNKERFNDFLYRIIDNELQWYIDQNDNGSYYLAFKHKNAGVHTSEGIGDGIWSIFTIIDALYDAEDNTSIIIDEPELSLHPQYQKKIMNLLLEESRNKQIIISTHSPYFISWDSMENGGVINRTSKNSDGEIEIKTLSKENIKFICKTVKDYHNPHLWGTDAKEFLFLEDNLIVVEGQEDVISFDKISNELDIKPDANFFGWGAGGAHKIENILDILKNLGYKNILAIYDGDKTAEYKIATAKFPEYNIIQIWEDDLREKPGRTIPYKAGVLDSHFKIREDNKEQVVLFMREIKKYFEKDLQE